MAHILVIDDDPGILTLLATILAKEGHTVAACSSGSDALKKLGVRPAAADSEPPDLVILDIMMPKVDGYSIGKTLRDNPRTRHIPILAVSALRELSRLFTATVQIDGFLHKPFSPEELIVLVRTILHPSRPAE